jgi:hypothetical protein
VVGDRTATRWAPNEEGVCVCGHSGGQLLDTELDTDETFVTLGM